MTVDQRTKGGLWNNLGEFDLAPGQNHRVSLSAVVGERTVADGVRFVPIVGARVVQADAVKIVPNTAEDALYVHADQLGTPRKLSDPTGAVVWDASLTPYGLEDSIAGTETLDSRFPGQWADAESGLSYNYFRDYDPTLGRYLQSDPIGLRGGLNTYAYVGGNPVNYTDLDGLARKKKFTKAPNPNQKKGAEGRQKSGGRERNTGHPEAEEHNRRPKGGFNPKRFPKRFPRIGPLLIVPMPLICNDPVLGPAICGFPADQASFQPEDQGGVCRATKL